LAIFISDKTSKTVKNIEKRAATVESVLVVKRTGQEINMEFGRDMW
jgi:hypothetical protein